MEHQVVGKYTRSGRSPENIYFILASVAEEAYMSLNRRSQELELV